MSTSTSSFGSSRRESHDSTDFYKRFDKIVESDDTTVNVPDAVDKLYLGTSEKMSELPDNCVDLMVTSPPYNSGKEYDVDQPFDEYLDFLGNVFEESYRVLKPGGRAAINVAGLGRKPYISLLTYVDALCLDIGYFPRGQIVWQKADGAGSSCAWGTFQSAGNPVLRDLHEYILVYSKGRYSKLGKGVSTISKEDFLRDTLSVWRINPESAKRVNHPAPYPVELPRRLINLYTYEEDLVLDPFMGSGTTAIAALATGRHYVGYDNDLGYYGRAVTRIMDFKKGIKDASSTK